MSDVVVTVPKDFKHPCAPRAKGLMAWLAEGDAPGEPDSGVEWSFRTGGGMPSIKPGERVYVVCDGRLVGYAPLIRMQAYPIFRGGYIIDLIRGGGAVACTINEPIKGFRGWRYRWWSREDERPLDLTGEIISAKRFRKVGS